MNTMDPWKSWGIVAIVSVGAYWYYANQQKNKRRNGRPAVVAEPFQSFRRKAENKKRGKKDNVAGNQKPGTSDAADVASVSMPSNSGGQIKQRRGGKEAKSVSQGKSSAVHIISTVPSAEEDGENDDVDNREFARQLASLKAGKSLETGSSEENVRPSNNMKESKMNGTTHVAPDVGLPEIKDVSGNSSTTGADADDDLSATNSPVFSATHHTDLGIADMLEKSILAPIVLRLTESTKPQRPSASKQSTLAHVEETKKQRQRKARKEAEKAERDQAEKERRVLMERQLRTAREARGEPAKNGVPISAPPASSPWAKATSSAAVSTLTSEPEFSNSTVPLLDTFDEDYKPASGTKQNIGVKRDPQVLDNSSLSVIDDTVLPSEEEQIRLLAEMESDDTWQMVDGKKRGGRKKGEAAKDDIPNGDTSQEGSSNKDDNSPAKPKKVRHTPYKNSPHPGNSAWEVA